MPGTKSYNPVIFEWNDSLIGDFIWSNVNVGDAISDVMTPFTWSILTSARVCGDGARGTVEIIHT